MRRQVKTSGWILGVILAGTATFGFGCSTPPSTPEASTPQAAAPKATEEKAETGKTTEATGNKLTIVFPNRGEAGEAQAKANAVAAFVSKQMGSPVEAIVADDTAAVEALRANRADVAFLSSRPALKAEQLANSRLYLAEVRPNYSGGHTYKSVFIVPKDSPLQDKGSGKATLEQLKGKRMAFVSPTSGSGFVFPVGELVKEGLVPGKDRLDSYFGKVSYGGDYTKAIQAVLRKEADVAAVSEYALNPPYITEEEKSKVRVLYAIAGVPAHGVSIDDDVPEATRTKLIAALMELNKPENQSLLKDLSNATELVKVDHDQHLNTVRTALKQAGVEL
ncbi:MAG TPA: phosphonate ABC transporter substrate-binding protein [Cyanobacteria bacterium UBA11149]|nr:phosphonate ABC transporter substrate-binding protein [Cyanobacteria bacterium UBA11367]HBE59017.1 phosphonate ABC transporter substrate-binding protein [Cyanobacteria bacterium UBA11366]HBK65255.1 phosphonate ABC transporter substrate-binding protein [Cyanobacteria bacterium UBA11166]HBR74041.1 phosphonate ABC transporter substrate-binding protein [Cyanobacteria bacterium UBA11159]HBS70343.1 phosphonate ABC transporter substrate-binding protein [Cyanobacteria bacterium UBA11153]HBW89480.1 